MGNKVIKMAKSKEKSTQTDGSSGEKMSVKKPIVTPVGCIKKEDEKEDIFCELNLVEDRKVKDAERALFRRLTRDARCEAWTWSQYYKDLVGDPNG